MAESLTQQADHPVRTRFWWLNRRLEYYIVLQQALNEALKTAAVKRDTYKYLANSLQSYSTKLEAAFWEERKLRLKAEWERNFWVKQAEFERAKHVDTFTKKSEKIRILEIHNALSTSLLHLACTLTVDQTAVGQALANCIAVLQDMHQTINTKLHHEIAIHVRRRYELEQYLLSLKKASFAYRLLVDIEESRVSTVWPSIPAYKWQMETSYSKGALRVNVSVKDPSPDDETPKFVRVEPEGRNEEYAAVGVTIISGLTANPIQVFLIGEHGSLLSHKVVFEELK